MFQGTCGDSKDNPDYPRVSQNTAEREARGLLGTVSWLEGSGDATPTRWATSRQGQGQGLRTATHAVLGGGLWGPDGGPGAWLLALPPPALLRATSAGLSATTEL